VCAVVLQLAFCGIWIGSLFSFATVRSIGDLAGLGTFRSFSCWRLPLWRASSFLLPTFTRCTGSSVSLMRSPKRHNQSVETNRRPASPLDAGRQFTCAVCAPPFLSAAVAHLCR